MTREQKLRPFIDAAIRDAAGGGSFGLSEREREEIVDGLLAEILPRLPDADELIAIAYQKGVEDTKRDLKSDEAVERAARWMARDNAISGNRSLEAVEDHVTNYWRRYASEATEIILAALNGGE